MISDRKKNVSWVEKEAYLPFPPLLLVLLLITRVLCFAKLKESVSVFQSLQLFHCSTNLYTIVLGVLFVNIIIGFVVLLPA